MLTVQTNYYGPALICAVVYTRKPAEKVVDVRARSGELMRLSLAYMKTLADDSRNRDVRDRLMHIHDTGLMPGGVSLTS